MSKMNFTQLCGLVDKASIPAEKLEPYLRSPERP